MLLKNGSTGNFVMYLQYGLHIMCCPPGSFDSKFGSGSVTQTIAVKSVVDSVIFVCQRVSARFLHGFCTVSKRANGVQKVCSRFLT